MDVDPIVDAVRTAVGVDGPVLLHAPCFDGNELKYVSECITTGWVSSAGSFVTEFEKKLAEFTGAKFAVAVVNGTCALHIALKLAGVMPGDEVLMPSLTFVATANAAAHCGAVPHLCDIEPRTLGLDAGKLREHLNSVAERRDGGCYNRQTGRRIAALVPMHTFGHPVDLDGVMQVAQEWGIPLVEDAAESLGSYYRGKHTGLFGRMGVLSFNGNKTITTGAGGAIITDDEHLAKHAKHVTTTAKLPHAWEFVHDEVGYNYRMPNLNAALGVAQLERLPELLRQKRVLLERYLQAFAGICGARIFTQPENCESNYWLQTLVLDEPDMGLRDAVLKALNDSGLQSRPVWRPMHQLAMYRQCPRMDLGCTEDMAKRIINVPSSPFLVKSGRC